MKKFSALLFLLPLFSCGRLEVTPPEGDSNAVCLNHTKAAGSNAAVFSFVREGGVVKVKHNGVFYNCACGEYGVTVVPSIDGQDLFLMEQENNPVYNCICEMEVYAEIGDIPSDTYVVHIVNGLGEDKVLPFDVNFSKDRGDARFTKQYDF